MLLGTSATPMKRYDLMNQVNARGTYLCSQKCLPYLEKSKHPHILNISPPLVMAPHWFQNHVAYTMAKYGMSMCVLGMSAEFKSSGIPVNALWPRTAISTAAIEMLMGNESMSRCRKPEIMADAAYLILSRKGVEPTGQFYIDDEVGYTFRSYISLSMSWIYRYLRVMELQTSTSIRYLLERHSWQTFS